MSASDHDDVAHAVAARVDEVGGRGAKGDVLAAVVDRRLVGGAVASLSRPPRGHEPRARAHAALVAERVLVDVGLAVAVARGQIGRLGGERHRVAGGRPARLRAAVTELAELGVVGVAVAGRATAGGRGEEGRARQALVVGLAAEDAHIDLARAARRRAGHEPLAGAAAGGEREVGRAGGEGHAVAGAVDLRVGRRPVGLAAAGGDRDARRRARAQVAHERVGLAVGVPGHEVVGGGDEGDAVAVVELVAVDVGQIGRAVGGAAVRGLGDQLGRARLPARGVGGVAAVGLGAMDREDVAGAVGVAGDDVRRHRVVGHERGGLAVLGDGRVLRPAVGEPAAGAARREARRAGAGHVGASRPAPRAGARTSRRGRPSPGRSGGRKPQKRDACLPKGVRRPISILARPPDVPRESAAMSITGSPIDQVSGVVWMGTSEAWGTGSLLSAISASSAAPTTRAASGPVCSVCGSRDLVPLPGPPLITRPERTVTDRRERRRPGRR